MNEREVFRRLEEMERKFLGKRSKSPLPVLFIDRERKVYVAKQNGEFLDPYGWERIEVVFLKRYYGYYKKEGGRIVRTPLLDEYFRKPDEGFKPEAVFVVFVPSLGVLSWRVRGLALGKLVEAFRREPPSYKKVYVLGISEVSWESEGKVFSLPVPELIYVRPIKTEEALKLLQSREKLEEFHRYVMGYDDEDLDIDF